MFNPAGLREKLLKLLLCLSYYFKLIVEDNCAAGSCPLVNCENMRCHCISPEAVALDVEKQRVAEQLLN
jgi:hypothetical protein